MARRPLPAIGTFRGARLGACLVVSVWILSESALASGPIPASVTSATSRTASESSGHAVPSSGAPAPDAALAAADGTGKEGETPAPLAQSVPWDYLTGDWGGWRARLDQRGIALELATVADFSGVSHHETGAAFARALFDVNVSVDLEKLTGWRGASAHAQYYGKAGQDGAAATGVWQPFSNIDAPDFHRVGELWLQQELAGGRLRLKAGRVDANTEFAAMHATEDFLNASMGFSPTIYLFPTYPSPAASVNAFLTLGPHVDLGVGLYDASGIDLDRLMAPGTNRFVVAQAGVNWAARGSTLDGRLAVGAWRHSNRFRCLEESGTTRRAEGPFVTFEQTVWREAGREAGDERSRHVHVFLQAGSADGTVSEFERHFSMGLSWRAPVGDRRDDLLGVVWSDLTLSRWLDDESAGGRESATGVFYLLRLTPWLTLKPDVQVITRHWESAGGRRRTPAATLRLMVDF